MASNDRALRAARAVLEFTTGQSHFQQLYLEGIAEMIDREAGIGELQQQLATAQHHAVDLQLERDELQRRLEAVVRRCLIDSTNRLLANDVLRLARGEG